MRTVTPGRMWGGKGCGAPCDFCRVLVGTDEIEYEIEGHLGGESLILHFHPRCYDTWRASREPPREPSSGAESGEPTPAK